MKKIKLFIYEPSINKGAGREMDLLLNDEANVIDAINEVDRRINGNGGFPVPDYESLLHARAQYHFFVSYCARGGMLQSVTKPKSIGNASKKIINYLESL